MKMLLTVASAVAGLVAGTLVPVGHAFGRPVDDYLIRGAYQAALRKAYFEPFSNESGVAVAKMNTTAKMRRSAPWSCLVP